jgi:hypothetical protein
VVCVLSIRTSTLICSWQGAGQFYPSAVERDVCWAPGCCVRRHAVAELCTRLRFSQRCRVWLVRMPDSALFLCAIMWCPRGIQQSTCLEGGVGGCVLACLLCLAWHGMACRVHCQKAADSCGRRRVTAAQPRGLRAVAVQRTVAQGCARHCTDIIVSLRLPGAGRRLPRATPSLHFVCEPLVNCRSTQTV